MASDKWIQLIEAKGNDVKGMTEKYNTVYIQISYKKNIKMRVGNKSKD